MDNVYENIDGYNKKKRRVLIIFDDMISHVMTNKKAQSMLKNCLLAVEN